MKRVAYTDIQHMISAVGPPRLRGAAYRARLDSHDLLHSLYQVFGQKKVVGSIVGGRSDMASMLQLAADQDIAPLIETLPMSKV